MIYSSGKFDYYYDCSINKPMQKKNRKIQTYVLWLLDMLCATGAFWLATYLRYHNGEDFFVRELYSSVYASMLMLCTIIHFVFNQDKDFIKRGIIREAAIVLLYGILNTLGIITVAYLMHDPIGVSRYVLIMFFFLDLAITFFSRVAVKAYAKHIYRDELQLSKVIIIAEKDNMDRVVQHFETGLTYKVTGRIILDGDQVYGNINGNPISTTMDQLLSVMLPRSFDVVFINTPEHKPAELSQLICGIQDMGVECDYCLDLPDLGGRNSRFGIMGHYPVIMYSYDQMNPMALAVKRAVDIIGSLVGLAICGILFPFLAIAIKLDSPGPIFFEQTRIGRNGRRFKFYKFRSMRVDAEQQLSSLKDRNEVQGLMFKMENDPRVTRVGRFIRKTSLDEFPQFLNVLKNEMSLVGTRPPTEEEFEHYTEHYRRRLSMKPGITGLWQVSGRSEVKNFDDVVNWDLQYIDNWSLGLDARILLQTIAVVFTEKGAK